MCTEPCYAPVFDKPKHWIGCIYLRIVGGIVVAVLAIPAIWDWRSRCVLKGWMFRMAHCAEGNADASIVLRAPIA